MNLRANEKKALGRLKNILQEQEDFKQRFTMECVFCCYFLENKNMLHYNADYRS